MTLSPLKFLQSGPPAPTVVQLPDGLFFVRAVPIAAGATAAEAAEQAGLALEALSPFPPSQLYHGFYWLPGAVRALVFAAYRRRFTADQVAEWENAELVGPAFAAALGSDPKPSTTLVMPTAEGVTAIYWDADPVPSSVVFRPIPPEATDDERAKIADELRDAVPSNRAVVLRAAPVAEASRTDREFVFRAEGFTSRLTALQAAPLDVRDKESLAALRRARARDVILWRVFLGCVAALVLLALGEGALVGLGMAQKAETTLVHAQQASVESIMTAQTLTTRINELRTRRLLPMEMIAYVSAKRPGDVYFSRSTTNGLYGLVVEAYTNSPASVSTFQKALQGLPELESVQVRDQRTRNNVMQFTLEANFKPGAIKPATSNP